MTPIAPHVTAFFRDRLPRERQASNHTCDAYAYSFKLLFAFMAKKLRRAPSAIDLEDFDAPIVLAFLRHLEEQRGCVTSTRNARLAAIRSFVRYLELRVPSAVNATRRILAIPMKRPEKRLVAHLTQPEIEAVLRQPDVSTRMGRRDRAMMHLCYAAGLRVTELVTLPMTAVSLGRRPIVHVLGKGRRERELPIWRGAASDLKAWLKVRDDCAAQEVFVGAGGESLTRSGFEYILSKYVAMAAKGYPDLAKKTVSPHVLRHSCAMAILAATGDIRKVSLWLGHADIKTTEVYLHADLDEKLAIAGAVVPPSLKRGRFSPPDSLIAALMEQTR
jgi:site-specific recombinase XerD